MITLRQDQAELKNGIYGGWSNGARNILAVLPTGGGKSVVVSDIVLDHHNWNVQQAVIAHRNELVSQMSMHVARRGITHRIIGSATTVREIINEHRSEFGRSFVSPSSLCSVGSIDTIVARSAELKSWAHQVGFWTIDEAHHVLRDNKWGKGVALFPNARGLGVTATPSRADGNGLGSHVEGVFDDMVIGPDMRWLIENNALTEYEIIVPSSDFSIDDDAITASGDYSQKKMREASAKSHIVGDVVDEYCKWAFGKLAVVFATDVETSGEIANRFNASGIAAVSISAKTPAQVRSEFIRRFRRGEIKVLVNVDLFGEGFDLPAIEVVIMARPTASLSVFLQQFGRALRTNFAAGKLRGLVIDHVSNWRRHGLPDRPRIWTLDRREKRGKKEPDPELIDLTVCKHCSRPYEPVHRECPHCGKEPPLPEPRERSVETVDGDLMLLDKSILDDMRARAQLESPSSVAARTTHVAGSLAGAGAANRQIEKIGAQQSLDEALALWAGYQGSKGRDHAEIQRRFFHATGVDVLTARSGTRAEMEKLENTVRGWLPK